MLDAAAALHPVSEQAASKRLGSMKAETSQLLKVRAELDGELRERDSQVASELRQLQTVQHSSSASRTALLRSD